MKTNEPEEELLRLIPRQRKGILRLVFSRVGIVVLLLILELNLLLTAYRWLSEYFKWFAGAQMVFAVLMVFYLFRNEMDASAKLTWLVLMMLFPVPASVMLWFTEADIGHRMERDRMTEMIEDTRGKLLQKQETLRKPEIVSSATDDLCYYLNRTGCFPLYENTEVEYFALGEYKFRAVLEELKKAENSVLGAKDKALQLEQELYSQVRDYLSEALVQVQETASALAQVDVLVSFAETASKNNYYKPEISIDGILDIRDGRHPVVEQMLQEDVFVPNNVYLDTNQNRLSIITGPNMSGKSTYMRQTALIVLMAQMGSFVPASYAKISAVDRIFTRVGASDDLAAGESTFMVEMKEVAEILKYATKDSLVILDEVGRGTSTFDGISIARAVAEYICNARNLGCKTLFATHYHELISLEQEMSGIKNYSIAVRKNKDGIRFLRKIVPGGTDDSYGIDVAKLAGLPNKVLERARELLHEMEANKPIPNQAVPEPEEQFSFDIQQENEIPKKLRRTNIAELSDSECREFLEELYAMLN